MGVIAIGIDNFYQTPHIFNFVYLSNSNFCLVPNVILSTPKCIEYSEVNKFYIFKDLVWVVWYYNRPNIFNGIQGIRMALLGMVLVLGGLYGVFIFYL